VLAYYQLCFDYRAVAEAVLVHDVFDRPTRSNLLQPFDATAQEPLKSVEEACFPRAVCARDNDDGRVECKLLSIAEGSKGFYD
jgi:hypothetical protein